jgi:hypothetical protein
MQVVDFRGESCRPFLASGCARTLVHGLTPKTDIGSRPGFPGRGGVSRYGVAPLTQCGVLRSGGIQPGEPAGYSHAIAAR